MPAAFARGQPGGAWGVWRVQKLHASLPRGPTHRQSERSRCAAAAEPVALGGGSDCKEAAAKDGGDRPNQRMG
uniref:Uncharacterized protein n=1 Tax=Leersia perrieri TaxID=77586 RepID=A0A0D9VKR7_9ORYZ